MKKNKTVEEFLKTAVKWQEGLATLREILLSTGLDEAIKWGAPCYSYEGKNLIGIGSFKTYFGLWFFQGALLSDKKKLLISGGEATRAMRQMRFESMKDINAKLIRSYVKEAIELAKKGVEIKPLKNKPLDVPDELTAALGKNKRAKTVFEKMSKSCQREYAEYISSAKQEATKQRRLEKIIPMIEAGGGMHDKYRDC